MSTLAWFAIAAAPFVLLGMLFAWALARAAGLGDEIQKMQKLAQLGQDTRNGLARNGVEILGYEQPEYRPVSRRHWRGL